MIKIIILFCFIQFLTGCGTFGGVEASDPWDECFGKEVDENGECIKASDPWDACFGKKVDENGECNEPA